METQLAELFALRYTTQNSNTILSGVEIGEYGMYVRLKTTTFNMWAYFAHSGLESITIQKTTKTEKFSKKEIEYLTNCGFRIDRNFAKKGNM